MNVVHLTGRLTADPELRTTKSGTDVCVLRIANNDREEPLFVDVETYGKQAKPCAEYLEKGRRALVIGRLEITTYEAQDGSKRTRTKVVGRVEFIDAKPGAGSAPDPDADIPF